MALQGGRSAATARKMETDSGEEFRATVSAGMGMGSRGVDDTVVVNKPAALTDAASGQAPSSSSLPHMQLHPRCPLAPPFPPPFSGDGQGQGDGDQQQSLPMTTGGGQASKASAIVSPLGVRPKRRRMVETALTKGGRRALYHCNYCSKDISNTYRIKCAVCLDFDLCIECFHVGVEVTPHKKNHHYKVVDNLSFPLFTPSWGTDEELLLIEAVEMYGLGNWKEVSDHVGTKREEECLAHYFEVYYGTNKSPLPDVENILGPGHVIQNTDDGGAPNGLAKSGIGNSSSRQHGTNNVIMNKDSRGGNVKRKKKNRSTELSGADSENCHPDNVDVDKFHDRGQITAKGRNEGSKHPSSVKNDTTDINKEQTTSASGSAAAQKHPAASTSSGSDITGYNVKREEFDVEHDPDAEVPLADLEINGKEDKNELAIKEKQLQFYYQRQQERYRRRKFVADRGLLDIKKQQGIERRHTREELEIIAKYRVFARYMTVNEFDSFAQGMINEYYLRQRIDELKELRRNGVTTLVEAEVYERTLKKREEQMERVKAVEAGVASSSGQKSSAVRSSRYLGRDESMGALVATGSLNRELQKLRSNSANASQLLAASWSQRNGNRKPLGTFIDIEGQPGYDALTEHEKELCTSCKLLPLFYLNIKETFIRENQKRGHLARADIQWEKQTSGLVPADNSKLNRVYDFLLQTGLIKSP